MDKQDFKKLFSGLLEEAGVTKPDQKGDAKGGANSPLIELANMAKKTPLGNALNKLAKSPQGKSAQKTSSGNKASGAGGNRTAPPQKTPDASKRAAPKPHPQRSAAAQSGQSAGSSYNYDKPQPNARMPSSGGMTGGMPKGPSGKIHKNLMNLRQYEASDDPYDMLDDDDDLRGESTPTFTQAALSKQREEDYYKPQPPRAKTKNKSAAKGNKSPSVNSRQMREQVEEGKQALIQKISAWQQALAEGRDPEAEAEYRAGRGSVPEREVASEEELVERLQTVLDLISGQILQINVKKSEIEAQKLLFDSTCTTLYKEREEHRRQIEALATQISQKHEDLARYLTQWEEDGMMWDERKAEVMELRAQALREQQRYQQSIADYVQQLESRQKLLTEHAAKLDEQSADWDQRVDHLSALENDIEQLAEVAKQQASVHLEALNTLKSDLAGQVKTWEESFKQFGEEKETWANTIAEAQALLKTGREGIEDEKTRLIELIADKQSLFTTWRQETTDMFNSRKAELTELGEAAINAVERVHQDIDAKQHAWEDALRQTQQQQQARFTEALAALSKQAETQINTLTAQLSESNALYLQLYREHQEHLSEAIRHDENAVTQAIWRNRLSFVVAFLPQLPAAVSTNDISLIFGGIEIEFKSPYQPPSEATIQVKWQQYATLPEAEKRTVAGLCRQIATQYKIACHPVAHSLLQNKEYFD